MPQSAEEIFELARLEPRGEDDLGFRSWPAFPWVAGEGEVLPRPLDPPVATDRVRDGEGGRPCFRCTHPDEGVVWRDDRWLLASSCEGRGGLLSFWLQTREHMDFGEMTEELAGELGRLVLRCHNAMLALPNAGRVHIGKWGDGSAHLHVLLMVRPERLAQVIGSFAVEWDDLLPVIPIEVWEAEVAQVAAAMAAGGDGEVLVPS
ncbi:hypothetical protein GCM10022199_17130 [Marihabitans asiaticum]|uniref:Diadenosine tetraphosphate (Ap4A) HIT family hydrolase n=1 Tax=Marihabitans asiaticum TaxID=415218 RepID=A0A560W7W8_9MICO|nr:hypothetical protein [Marihabitans asiaticum]TWD13605.1 hypothetical protein FB557_2232 [Marihabitans asiaticum]